MIDNELDEKLRQLIMAKIEKQRSMISASELVEADLEIFEMALQKPLAKLSVAEKLRLLEILI